jgi:hypothetical protein
MALPILDGNQSATTLSSILTSGEHIPAHTVVSLGTQAITDISGAVSGSVVSISNFPATQPVSIASVTVGNSVTIGSLPLIAGTVTVGNSLTIQSGNISIEDVFGENSFVPISGTVTIGAGTAQIGSVTASNLADVLDQYEVNAQDKLFAVVASLNGQGYVSDSAKSHITNSVTIGSLPLIAGTVTANLSQIAFTNTEGGIASDDGGEEPNLGIQLGYYDGDYKTVKPSQPLPITGTVTVGNSVTIASFATSVTARLINPAGTAVTYAEVGTAGSPSIDVLSVQGVTSGTAIPISISSVTIGSLPAISGTVTANTFALQGTAVTTSDFTSTTASTLLAGFNAGREVLTIFNEGAGQSSYFAGATCTTIAYQVRLSAGDYYEVPNHQTTITHSAVFATAGTARVTEVS